MNYKKAYDKLMETRKNRPLKEGEYYERHHIVPECMGGTGKKHNMVSLTAREHYIAHWLLVKMYPDAWKLHHAFYQMSKINPAQKNKRIISSKQFDRARKHLSIGAKLRQQDPGYINPGKSENSRRAARERMNSDRNPMKGNPEKNPTARPHRVIFDDGTERVYQYGKLGYEDLGISRSSWITATRTGRPLPTFKIKQIVKE